MLRRGDAIERDLGAGEVNTTLSPACSVHCSSRRTGSQEPPHRPRDPIRNPHNRTRLVRCPASHHRPRSSSPPQPSWSKMPARSGLQCPASRSVRLEPRLIARQKRTTPVPPRQLPPRGRDGLLETFGISDPMGTDSGKQQNINIAQDHSSTHTESYTPVTSITRVTSAVVPMPSISDRQTSQIGRPSSAPPVQFRSPTSRPPTRSPNASTPGTDLRVRGVATPCNTV